jgi:hypothetical protein
MSECKLTGSPVQAQDYEGEIEPTGSVGPELDPSKYLSEIQDYEITEAQKMELLETLWSIMRSFVEAGFELNICEQIFLDCEESSAPIPTHAKLISSTKQEKPSGGSGEENSA